MGKGGTGVMRRRSFLAAAGTALIGGTWKSAAEGSLGSLAWVDAEGLWIRALPDGQAGKIASGEGLDEPRFSASGRWIAYRKGAKEILVVRSDGIQGTTLGEWAESTHFRWLPLEDRLAVPEEHDVAVYDPADNWKKPMAVWKHAGLGVFSPDGQEYAAERIHERPGDPRTGLNQDLAEFYVGDVAAGQEPRVLIPNHEGDIQPYAWTRDGKSIVYWGAEEWSSSIWADGVDLYLVPAAGGPERKLGITALAHDDMLDLAPAALGNKLAVTRARGRETWANTQIVLADLDSGAMRDLTPDDVAAQCPAWSPDGKRIAYFAAPDAEIVNARKEAGGTIKIIRPDGTVQTEVMTPTTRIGIGGEEAHPFLQQRRIWLLDVLGGVPPRPLTDDARYRDEEPMWSADGSHILFGRMDYEGHASLWLIESGGANPRQVCGLAFSHHAPAVDDWFGYYGYVDWRSAFDWRR